MVLLDNAIFLIKLRLKIIICRLGSSKHIIVREAAVVGSLVRGAPFLVKVIILLILVINANEISIRILILVFIPAIFFLVVLLLLLPAPNSRHLFPELLNIHHILFLEIANLLIETIYFHLL